jgi:hypothetical protein
MRGYFIYGAPSRLRRQIGDEGLNRNAVSRFELTLDLVQSLRSPCNDYEIVAIRGQALGISSADAG